MNPSPQERTVSSPCIDVCRIDADSGLCVGCWRTMDEIVRWGASDANTRLAVLAAVDKRRAEHKPSDPMLRGDHPR